MMSVRSVDRETRYSRLKPLAGRPGLPPMNCIGRSNNTAANSGLWTQGFKSKGSGRTEDRRNRQTRYSRLRIMVVEEQRIKETDIDLDRQ